MIENRTAEDLISRIAAGEFEGRVYKTIMGLSRVERKEIAALAARERNREELSDAGQKESTEGDLP